MDIGLAQANVLSSLAGTEEDRQEIDRDIPCWFFIGRRVFSLCLARRMVLTMNIPVNLKRSVSAIT